MIKEFCINKLSGLAVSKRARYTSGQLQPVCVVANLLSKTCYVDILNELQKLLWS